MSFREKLSPGVPKKLLSLDGGGVRGLIAIEFLARIESALRDVYGRSDLVLADYFDYVGGTSTGAIIGTFVALGMPVDELREIFVKRAREMFSPSKVLQRFQNRYVSANLERILKVMLGDMTLGSDALRTLLLLVMRNATTDSPWPVSNNPSALFNDRGLPHCNLKLPLWQLVRASTAAPLYFPPEVIDIGGERFIFVDGAVTMYNNPAFLLFLMATLEPYRLRWPSGEENMLVISVGTGLSRHADANLKTGQMNLLYTAGSVPAALIYSAQVEQDKLCRIFGKSRARDALDAEIGDLSAAGPLGSKLFTYMRYNVALTRAGLDGLGLTKIREDHVRPLDCVERVEELQCVGRAAAARLVDVAHFEGFLGA
jgi:hypothetical protein